MPITFQQWESRGGDRYRLRHPKKFNITMFDENTCFTMTHRAAIVHGLNGGGKTTLLQAIARTYPNVLYTDCNDHPFMNISNFIPDFHAAFPKYIALLDEILHEKKICSLKPFGLYFQQKSNEVRPFDWFSDGEKNIAIILAIALFSKEEIICFDNIERSLHVALQDHIVTQLLEISSKIFIITTHSPCIVNDNRYMTIGITRSTEMME